MWCGMILGQVLQMQLAACSLTGVGAGEEQAPNVVASEASRCGEDN
jgi:hypothetical protein